MRLAGTAAEFAAARPGLTVTQIAPVAQIVTITPVVTLADLAI
ncbi:hypothetical protein [Streptomyces sp. NPDC021622]